MTFLAQIGSLAPPEGVAWSSFAPELPPTIAALVLLLVAIAKRRPMLVLGPTAVVALAAGVWLIGEEQAVAGVVTIALGIAGAVLAVVFPRRGSMIQAWGASLALLAALVLTGWQWAQLTGDTGSLLPQAGLAGALANDGIAFFARLTVYFSALIVIPLGYGYLQDRRINRAEVEPLILLCVVGMAALGSANDLITAFIALEVLSLALYVLAGLARRDRRSQEASLKYFVTGSVASAILLYGMALTYVATGSVGLYEIDVQLIAATSTSGVAVLGLALVTVGLGFKVALAPFHLWAPDVYQGAPTPITAFMAAATKAAAFAALLRLYLVAFPELADLWVPALAVLSAITMLYGAYVAVVQSDIKRMLAYSAISHAGYAAVGVAANSDAGLSAVLWYLVTYAVSSLGAFGCVIAIERMRQGEVTLRDLRGLWRTSPALAGFFGLCLLSLAGIPATAGFVGKLVVFQAGVAAGLTWLVVIGVVSSVIAAFFYLRIAGMMFLEDPEEGRGLPLVTTGLSFGLSVPTALVLFLGVWPQEALQFAESAAALLR